MSSSIDTEKMPVRPSISASVRPLTQTRPDSLTILEKGTKNIDSLADLMYGSTMQELRACAGDAGAGQDGAMPPRETHVLDELYLNRVRDKIMERSGGSVDLPLPPRKDSGSVTMDDVVAIVESLPYELIICNRIGVGGFSEVYLVESPRDGSRLALKVFNSTEYAIGVYAREVASQVWGRAINSRIPNVIEMGLEPSLPYILMEYIEGSSFGSHLKKPEFMNREEYVKEVLRIGSSVADSLSSLHLIGLLHGDITPNNILIRDSDGVPYLLDFGLTADAKDPDPFSHLFPADSRVGTRGYLAPERVQSGTVSMLTDQYGLGAVLYRALTARYPYDADRMAFVDKDSYYVTDPRMYNRDCPAGVAAVILKSLEFEMNCRYVSCGEFSRALERELKKME